MISALEAKMMAEKANTQQADLSDIESQIKERANEGQNTLIYFGDLDTETIQTLKKLEFEVRLITARNQANYEICW